MSATQLRNLLRMVRLARAQGPPSLEQVRLSMDRMGQIFGLDERCRRVEPLASSGPPPRVEWLVPKALSEQPPETPRQVLFCIHGGGFCAGSLASHRGLYSRLAAEAGCTALSVSYRWAPESPYPAAVDDVEAAVHWLLARSPETRWCAAADSAGAALLVWALQRLDPGTWPRGVLLLSPWLDLQARGASFEELDDPLVSHEGVLRMARRFAGERSLDDPELALLDADYAGWPPTLIQVGEQERLLDDSRSLAAVLRAAGVQVELSVWPDMVHVFQQFAPRVDEGREALARGGRFLADRLRESVGRRIGFTGTPA